MTFLIYVAIALLSILVIYILLPWGAKLLIRKQFLNRAKYVNAVFLTFDDGPNPDVTPKILELLKGADAKATFFVLGKNVKQYPDIAKSIVENGHEIAEHSYEHLHAWKTGPVRTLRDLVRGERTLKTLLEENRSRVSFRPPFGKLNLVTLLYVLFRRKRIAFWNRDPKDYAANSAQEVANFVIRGLKAGDVILLHDGGNNRNNSVTTEALSMILEACQRKGLRTSLIREGIS